MHSAERKLENNNHLSSGGTGLASKRSQSSQDMNQVATVASRNHTPNLNDLQHKSATTTRVRIHLNDGGSAVRSDGS